MGSKSIKFILNGKDVSVKTLLHRRLLDVIREDFGLTGTKEGCGIGECGACTVLLNGKAVNACLVLAGQIEGAEIMTVEHLAKDGQLNKLQQRFLEKGAVQCGFCTPGMLMSATALLMHKPSPTREEIQDDIAGNLCRCTGYKQIIEAIYETAYGRKKNSSE
ncbi:MAG: (2Fe-2S)-binding protein [Calditrichaeota bacterium]|nr:(2Fe-2S)-binding protein [Calditrichota bacterium]RQV98865.1 MAG: (2Fe-2S)-binding protein [Calditrichota bacterium]